MHCLYIILHTGIIIFLKPGLEPRLWAFSCCKPSPSPIQARWWAGLGRAQMGWAWVGFGLWARPSTSLGLPWLTPLFKLHRANVFEIKTLFWISAELDNVYADKLHWQPPFTLQIRSGSAPGVLAVAWKMLSHGRRQVKRASCHCSCYALHPSGCLVVLYV